MFGAMSLTHWLVVALVIAVLFGRNKIGQIMGDFGKGIKDFRSTMKEIDNG